MYNKSRIFFDIDYLYFLKIYLYKLGAHVQNPTALFIILLERGSYFQAFAFQG